MFNLMYVLTGKRYATPTELNSTPDSLFYVHFLLKGGMDQLSQENDVILPKTEMGIAVRQRKISISISKT